MAKKKLQEIHAQATKNKYRKEQMNNILILY